MTAGLYFASVCYVSGKNARKEDVMAWTTPILIEICIGLEINGYLPPEL